MNNNIFEAIKRQGFLPLYFHKSEAVTIGVLKALYSAGVRVVEYTNRGDEALNNFKAIVRVKDKEFPGLQLGIGTIKDAVDAEDYILAGADFLISPCFSDSVLEVVHRHKATWIPGCMTPTEINHAEQKGIQFIKIFPGNILQPQFVSAVKDLFPNMNFMPTGGVDLSRENIEEWFKAGVCAVGMGSKLISKKLMEAEEYGTIQSLTVQAFSFIQSIRK